MNGLIENLLIVSIQASILVVATLVLRVILSKTHKIFTYFMWLVVLLRLCIPVAVESPYGIFNAKQDAESAGRVISSSDDGGSKDMYADYHGNASLSPDNVSQSTNQNMSETSGQASSQTQNQTVVNQSEQNVLPSTNSSSTAATVPSADKVNTGETVKETDISYTTEQLVTAVWTVGAVGVLLLVIMQGVKLKRSIRFAINTDSNIWETDSLKTAFVVGTFRPRIYIPADIDKKEKEYIVMHERMHIKHGDHIVRIVMLMVNIVYWWNPVIWVATHFMKHDMEMLCDESVVRNMEEHKCGAYLRTLLSCSVKNSGIIPVMSFGESNTEKRIRHIVSLKKPKLYIYAMLSVFLLVGIVGCGSVTKTASTENNTDTHENSEASENDTNAQESSDISENITDNITESLEEDSSEDGEYSGYDSFVFEYEKELYVKQGRYVAEGEGDNTYIDIEGYGIEIGDTDKVNGGLTPEMYMSSQYAYLYYTDYNYCIFSKDKIEVYADYNKDTVIFDVKVIDKTILEFDGTRYIHESVTDKEKTVTISKTGYEQYDKLIDEMIEIQNSDKDEVKELLEGHNMSDMWYYDSTFKHGGFYLIDLDGDGTEEMLWGENGPGAWAGMIYDIYTIKDGELVKLCTGWGRNRYQLSTGNVIINEGSSGASNSCFGYYTCQNGELVLGKMVEYDEDLITDEVSYAEVDENFNVIKYISESEYDEVVNSYAGIPIEFTLFQTVTYN